MLTATAERARTEVSAASTVAFRVAFGLLIAYSSVRFLWRGWVDEFYLDPSRHLTYPGLDWIRPWPAPWMQIHVAALAALGLLIACGIRTRLAAALFTLGFTYVELIDRALYLNHYWFVSLTAVLLALLPAPGAARTVPVITVWALRFQLGVVYTFAGIAKLNPDWIRHGEPMRTWLAARTDRPLIGWALDEPGVALAASVAGVLFDLTIVGWLLWRRSRPWAYAVLVVFHVATAMLFQIGIFPWVMIALTPIFFAPDWPLRLKRQLRSRPAAAARHPTPSSRPDRVSRLLVVALVLFATLNVVVPLRHWIAAGDVRWNDDGYELSWRVMLTDRSGYLEFDVVDPATGGRWRVEPELVLTEWQVAEAETRAPLALQTAHLVADHFARLGHPDVEVYGDSFVAMNGRLRQRMLDPAVDLAHVSRWSPATDYVLPLDPPVLD
jgi:vitamin K-dependent gamma-carboxylase